MASGRSRLKMRIESAGFRIGQRGRGRGGVGGHRRSVRWRVGFHEVGPGGHGDQQADNKQGGKNETMGCGSCAAR